MRTRKEEGEGPVLLISEPIDLLLLIVPHALVVHFVYCREDLAKEGKRVRRLRGGG